MKNKFTSTLPKPSEDDQQVKVKEFAGRPSKAIKSVQDLKKVFDEKFGKGALKKKKKLPLPEEC